VAERLYFSSASNISAIGCPTGEALNAGNVCEACDWSEKQEYKSWKKNREWLSMLTHGSSGSIEQAVSHLNQGH